MSKQTLLLLFKFFIWLCLSGVMAMDYVILYGINPKLLYTYKLLMFVCSISFLGTFFPKIRKICYIIFTISFTVYILFHWLPEIKEGYDADACLDSGRGVWDYDEHRCRTDCYHWSREKGCLKE